MVDTVIGRVLVPDTKHVLDVRIESGYGLCNVVGGSR